MKNSIKAILFTAELTLVIIMSISFLMPESKNESPQAIKETGTTNKPVSEVNTKPFYKY
jgi:hypothetical protein